METRLYQEFYDLYPDKQRIDLLHKIFRNKTGFYQNLYQLPDY